MRKLVRGIVHFRQTIRDDYRETFARLALGQKPDTLFIACSDSRVVPNLFASSEPGDLFVIRNVGNMISPAGPRGLSLGDESEAAAIEFAVQTLDVEDIIICGHSECGAMQAIYRGRESVDQTHLRSWLRHGEAARARLEAGQTLDPELAPHNTLSQLNVLLQLEHLATYTVIREKLEAGELRLHGWWFDIGHADVYAYEQDENRFVLIDEGEAAAIETRLGPARSR